MVHFIFKSSVVVASAFGYLFYKKQDDMRSITWARAKHAFKQILKASGSITRNAQKIPDLDIPERKLTENTIRVLSQNAWCSYFAGGKGKTERLNLFANCLEKHAYDVILLQEVFIFGFGRSGTDITHYRTITEHMQNHGYSYHSDPFKSLASNIGQNSGLIVFSKYPFDLNSTYFETFRDRRTFSAKGFQHVTVEFGNDQVHFINTHTEHKDKEMRRKQLVQIFNYVDRTFANEKVVISGDFNICQETQEDQYSALQALFEPYPNIFFDLEGASYRQEVDAVAEVNVRKIDHVFTNADMVPESARYVDFHEEDSIVSDHYGLEFGIYVRPSPDEIEPGKLKKEQRVPHGTEGWFSQ